VNRYLEPAFLIWKLLLVLWLRGRQPGSALSLLIALPALTVLIGER